MRTVEEPVRPAASELRKLGPALPARTAKPAGPVRRAPLAPRAPRVKRAKPAGPARRAPLALPGALRSCGILSLTCPVTCHDAAAARVPPTTRWHATPADASASTLEHPAVFGPEEMVGALEKRCWQLDLRDIAVDHHGRVVDCSSLTVQSGARATPAAKSREPRIPALSAGSPVDRGPQRPTKDCARAGSVARELGRNETRSGASHPRDLRGAADRVGGDGPRSRQACRADDCQRYARHPWRGRSHEWCIGTAPHRPHLAGPALDTHQMSKSRRPPPRASKRASNTRLVVAALHARVTSRLGTEVALSIEGRATQRPPRALTVLGRPAELNRAEARTERASRSAVPSRADQSGHGPLRPADRRGQRSSLRRAAAQ